ncbi:MAG: DNA primase [Pseudomonadales bacterium]
MAGLIPQAFIDELLDRVDIAEIVEARVPLRRTGRNAKGLCPFHKEKSPSFTVNSEKQFYYCFGCGAGGNAIGFLIDYERMEFPQAVESLAHLCGLEVPREESPQRAQQQSQNKPLYELLDRCSKHYQLQLRSHAQAKKAVDYLKNRGLNGITAKQYGIGFAPEGWNNLEQALAGDDKLKKQLVTAGMLIENAEKKTTYDRFRDRIMFPIRDIRGRVIAFGGRVLGDDNPKYLNSPETPVFNKSRELYGLHEARLANRKLKRLIIVEGYMDVVALAQYGITYAAATMGTAVGSSHLERIFRQTSEVVFCFDGDNAGRAAAGRALEASLEQIKDGRQAWFLFLADGEDPDSMVQKIGKEAFEAQIDAALPLSEFLFASSAEGLDLQSVDGRARLAQRALPQIEKVPDGAFKQLLLQDLASRTGLSEAGIGQLIQQAAPPPPTEEYEQESVRAPAPQPVQRKLLQKSQKKPGITPMRTATTLLMFEPELAKKAGDFHHLQGINDPEAELLLELLQSLKEVPDRPPGALLGAWLNTDKDAIARRLFEVEHLLPEEGTEQEFTDAMNRVRQQLQHQHYLLEKTELEAIGLAQMTSEQKNRYRELMALLQNRHSLRAK